MFVFCKLSGDARDLHVLTHPCPTRRSSDLDGPLGAASSSRARPLRRTPPRERAGARAGRRRRQPPGPPRSRPPISCCPSPSTARPPKAAQARRAAPCRAAAAPPGTPAARNSVVSGKSVAGRVGLGGRRIINKKKKE